MHNLTRVPRDSGYYLVVGNSNNGVQQPTQSTAQVERRAISASTTQTIASLTQAVAENIESNLVETRQNIISNFPKTINEIQVMRSEIDKIRRSCCRLQTYGVSVWENKLVTFKNTSLIQQVAEAKQQIVIMEKSLHSVQNKCLVVADAPKSPEEQELYKKINSTTAMLINYCDQTIEEFDKLINV